MNSLDTNVLFYGTHTGCPEHVWARPVLERLLAEPARWIVADQVLFEYYRLLRNPAVLEKPLSATEALERARFFRDEAGCEHCGYDLSCWADAAGWLSRPDFPARRTFDAVLAATLRANGVRRFFTRNARDFTGFGWFEVVDPAPSAFSL